MSEKEVTKGFRQEFVLDDNVEAITIIIREKRKLFRKSKPYSETWNKGSRDMLVTIKDIDKEIKELKKKLEDK